MRTVKCWWPAQMRWRRLSLSVPFYDKEGNRYDLKGKVIPKRSPRRRRPEGSMCPASTERPRRSCLLSRRSVEHIRVAVARAKSRRSVKPIGCEPRRLLPQNNREQAARLDSLSEQVAMLTAKLTAAESQISQAEARAARAEAQLAQTLETVRSMEEKGSTPRCLRLSLRCSAQVSARACQAVGADRSPAVSPSEPSNRRENNIGSCRVPDGCEQARPGSAKQRSSIFLTRTRQACDGSHRAVSNAGCGPVRDPTDCGQARGAASKHAVDTQTGRSNMKRSKREPQKLVPILRELGYRIREVYAPTSDRLKPRPGDSALSPQSLSDSRVRADQPGPTGRPRDPRQPGLPRQQGPKAQHPQSTSGRGRKCIMSPDSN